MPDKVSVRYTSVRAKEICKYLINKGISSNRLTSKGYEDFQPLIKNAKTEVEHQMNRRVEFVLK